jgi:hypothetical protein
MAGSGVATFTCEKEFGGAWLEQGHPFYESSLICARCPVIENCVVSSCATGTDAVCTECEHRHFAFRHDEDSTRCLPADSVNMVGSGLTEDSTGIFSYLVPENTTIETGSLHINGALVTVRGADDGSSLLQSIDIATTGGGSLSMVSLGIPVQAFNTGVYGLSGAGSRLSLEAVTFVEHPEWGVLTGTVTVGADNGLVVDPLALPLPFFFTVTSGPCTLAEGRRCVGRWPGGYLPNEHCDILVGGGGGWAAGGVLGPCPVFDTINDALTLQGGAEYSASCPAGVPLAAGDAISWTSNGDSQGSPNGGNGLPFSYRGLGGGWQICFA